MPLLSLLCHLASRRRKSISDPEVLRFTVTTAIRGRIGNGNRIGGRGNGNYNENTTGGKAFMSVTAIIRTGRGTS